LSIVFHDKFNNDVIHQCSPDVEALQNEDIVNTGKFIPIDKNTLDTSTDGGQIYVQGLENKADGWARMEGVRVHNYTSRGNRLQTHRTRQHYEFIDFRE
jgi:hypothetical protein